MSLGKLLGQSCLVLALWGGSLNLYAQISGIDYALGPGDTIKISVFGQDDLSVETKLSNLGVIRYPFLGDIRLTGKSVNQIEIIIDEGLRGDYLVDPSVSVTVLEYRPFFISGEVRRAGAYQFQPGLTLDKAVALAGGFTDRANKQSASVKRTMGDDEAVLEVELGSTIVPGDIITINARFF